MTKKQTILLHQVHCVVVFVVGVVVVVVVVDGGCGGPLVIVGVHLV